MEENKQVDRLKIIKIVMSVIFLAILVKIIYMTTFKYEYYNELAENKTYKKLAIEAPRGEIKDRYGRLLAGNKNLFTVQVSGNDINKKDANKHSRANEISLKLINLLERNGEEYVDEFPIYVEMESTIIHMTEILGNINQKMVFQMIIMLRKVFIT